MVKEVAGYEKEAKDNEAKVQKMRDDGKDSYDIRKQEEVSHANMLRVGPRSFCARPDIFWPYYTYWF